MDRQKAHQLVDELYDKWEHPALRGEPLGPLEERKESSPELLAQEAEAVESRVLPEGKRVVRTKSSGDRVYLLDEVKKTRHWITSPEILKAQGFELDDVTEVDDQELLKYQMAAALYRVEA